jgi:transposase
MHIVGDHQPATTAEIVFKGRRFGTDDLRLIEEVVGSCGLLSRQELANTVCELLGWRRAKGGLKTWECRELLEVLEREGRVRLPAASSRGRPRGRSTTVVESKRGEPQNPVCSPLRELEPISLRLVQSAEDRRLWRELVERYHPEGHRVPFGAHLRYFVEAGGSNPGVLVCLQLSSPAWRMAARDRWIGWSEEARKASLQRVVNNSRFLVLPWVRVPNLASRVLGLMARRVSRDWKRAFGVEPLLLETVVAADQAGTCYRAANWSLVGQTTGRGRSDRSRQREPGARKKIFVYALQKCAVEQLCRLPRRRVDRAQQGKGMDGQGEKGREGARKQKLREVRARFELLGPHLDERARRCWFGAEALAHGRGGVSLVAEACSVSHTTVEAGVRDVQQVAQTQEGQAPVRRAGGGRKPIEETHPGIKDTLEALVDPSTRGDPESPLRWTTKSLRNLSNELIEQGFAVGPDSVGRLLRELKYSLQANAKKREGKQHEDRDAQFHYIAEKTKEFLAAGNPVISVDTKKKEKIGNYKNGGREYQPQGQPEQVETHDFGQRDADGSIIHGIPYGVYDVNRNEGWVSVGVDHDTSHFAVNTIDLWWQNMGKLAYPQTGRVMITADSGGSNGRRVRAWKAELQRLANELGIEFHVSHFPPGTSKWNKIEHRLFSQITLNWRGRPLTSHEIMVQLIANTTTSTGLRVEAALDPASYPTGIKVSDKDFKAIRNEGVEFHPEWNYAIRPQTSE